MVGLEDEEVRKNQLKEQVETLSDIKGEMDNFLELIKVKIALGNRITNGNFHIDDDLAINNIDLVS